MLETSINHSSGQNTKRWALAVAALQIICVTGVLLLWPKIFELGQRLGDVLATQVHKVAVITKDKFANVAKAATSLKFMLGALACAVILEVVQSSGIRLCVS